MQPNCVQGLFRVPSSKVSVSVDCPAGTSNSIAVITDLSAVKICVGVPLPPVRRRFSSMCEPAMEYMAYIHLKETSRKIFYRVREITYAKAGLAYQPSLWIVAKVLTHIVAEKN